MFDSGYGWGWAFGGLRGWLWCYRFILEEMYSERCRLDRAEFMARISAAQPKAPPPKRHRTYNWH